MDIYEFLKIHRISYERYDHEPVYTCEQADCLDIPGISAKTKNLFLRDRKGRRHFLVTVGAGKSVDIKALETVLDAKGLSFASPERMERYLGLHPGSVTLFGVINDHEGNVEVIVDRDLLSYDAMQCHPLVNTSTLVVSMNDVMKFLEITGHHPRVLAVPGQGNVSV
jgi:Ala-tRNA(Pro) deacylase